MDTKELIKAKKDLEYNIFKQLQAFEKETNLTINDINIEKNNFSFPDTSKITDIYLEVLLP